ncbi:MAG: metal-dependent hydrolase [Salinigranum sp.]
MTALTQALSNPARDLLVLLDIVFHGVVGYTAVYYLTDFPPRWGLVGGLVPNLDLPLSLWFAFPLVHRGIFHTVFFLAVLLLALFSLGIDRRAIGAFGVGYLFELATDTLETTRGVMWLYPLSTHHFAYPPPVSEYLWLPVAFGAVVVLLAAAVRGSPRRSD